MPNRPEFTIECDIEDAPKFLGWIEHRGGVLRWSSVNLANPAASWSTPALAEAVGDDAPLPYTKPNWQCGNEPVLVTDPQDIGVYIPELFKAFPVATRISRNGLSTKLTDHSMAKLNRQMDECRERHGDAFYRRGVLDIDRPSMGVYFTKMIMPLPRWAAANLKETTND